MHDTVSMQRSNLLGMPFLSNSDNGDRSYITKQEILHGEFMVDETIPEKPDNAGELEKQGVEELAHTLHDSTDPKVRQYAAYLLGSTQNPRAIQPLIEALGDFDKSVRAQAMSALVTIGRAAVEPLTSAMNEPQWETRYRAVEALGKIADERAVQPLIQALKDNRDHVRYMAAKGLREIGDSDAVDPMIILLKDENRYVRMMSVWSLGAIGGKKVHDALRHALKHEGDEKVKEAITQALK
jgi:HEAT repeat protein